MDPRIHTEKQGIRSVPRTAWKKAGWRRSPEHRIPERSGTAPRQRPGSVRDGTSVPPPPGCESAAQTGQIYLLSGRVKLLQFQLPLSRWSPNRQIWGPWGRPFFPSICPMPMLVPWQSLEVAFRGWAHSPALFFCGCPCVFGFVTC